MIKNENMKELKESYMNIKIPENLNSRVDKAIKNNTKKNKIVVKLIATASSVCLVIVCVNISSIFANALEKIPVIGTVIKVINLKNYRINENGFEVSIDIPRIEGLEDKELEYKLNKDFEEEGKRLYDEYIEEMKSLKADNIEGRELIESWYEIKTDKDDLLSLVIFNHQAQGSSNTTRKFYNIDKNKKTLLTLEGMFENNDYVNIISENIKEQMKERMIKNPDEYYWLDDEISEFNFKEIKKDQSFYINDKNELVICFDKYEVGPGSTGLTEFIIPNKIIELLKN